MKIAAVFLSAFCAAAVGIPLGDHVQHEKRAAGQGLTKSTEAVDADAKIPVRIALKQRNLERGMELLMAVSDPESPTYGQHYSADQVTEMFSPDPSSIAKVTKWLRDAGIDGVTVPKSKGFVDFHATTAKLESLLQAKYHIYDHPATGNQHMGTDEYHLPREISSLVDFVAPGIVTGTVRKRSDKLVERPGRPARVQFLGPSLATQGCDKLITPKCIKQIYNITDGTLNDPSNAMGLFEADDEVHTQSDLDMFYSKYATKIPKGTGPKINLIDWNGQKPNPSAAVGEAALDFDMAIPLIYPQGTELYQSKDNFDGQQQLGIFNQWLDAIDGSYCTASSHGETGDDPTVDGTTANEMCGTLTPTNVISVSYGLSESVWPANYLERQCDEFMKLGLQGTSIVFASGDGGVAGGHGGDCLGDNGEIFNPPGPGSCPYVTAVGATYLPAGSSIDSPESATTYFSSGGGFSNVWAQPDYQKDAVSSFFANNDPGFPSYTTQDGVIPKDGGIYNKAGRGYPDVAALGDNGAIVLKGRAAASGGTSMSAPIFAAILTRLNEERIALGKKPIGFANPALYQNPAMFNDITIGEQSDANGNGACGGKGFKAVTGWDPVTGLGTPNYPAMLEYFKNL